MIYKEVMAYCLAYNVPIENLIAILEDQKVLPMIRGKATEYAGAAFLKQTLNPAEWDVQKLNLNPQPGTIDEDVSVTFLRTGRRLKVETKNAVRGGFKLTKRTNSQPCFQVKCHKSRSHLKRQKTTNDRYLVGEFDLLLCNVSNALFKGKAMTPGLPLLDDSEAIDWAKNFYKVSTDEELVRNAYLDWRICLPASIADENGVIPRTPLVLMENDPNWFGPDQLEEKLLTLIN